MQPQIRNFLQTQQIAALNTDALKLFSADPVQQLSLISDALESTNSVLNTAGVNLQFNATKLIEILNQTSGAIIGIDNAGRVAMAVTINGEVKIKELLGLIELVDISPTPEEVRTSQTYIQAQKQKAKNIRKAFHNLLLGIITQNEYVLPEGIPGETSAQIGQLLNAGLFTDQLVTFRSLSVVNELASKIVDSGIYIYTPELAQAVAQGPEAVLELLSALNHADLLSICGIIDMHFGTTSIDPRIEQYKDSANNAKRQPAQPKGIVAPHLEVPADTRIASVLGISKLMELSGTLTQDRVQVLSQETQPGFREFVTYGTTDFANPVEAVMTAVPNAAEQLYIADETAHTVGSYLSRIMLPTIGSLTNMDNLELSELLARAVLLENVENISLVELVETLANTKFTAHIRRACARAGLVFENTDFKALYKKLNQDQANHLGIEYISGLDMLKKYGFQLKDMLEMSQVLADKGQKAYQAIGEYVKNRVPNLSEKDFDDFMNMLLGKAGTWSVENRVVVKDAAGQDVDATTLSPETSLADLLEMGYKFGGNAWGIIDNLLTLKRDGVVTVAHKNTKQGGNYAMLLQGTDRVNYTLLPIVRVVPRGNNAATTGDGLDITAYQEYPQLYELVARYLCLPKDENSTDWVTNVLGGKSQIIIEVGAITLPVLGQMQETMAIDIYTQPVEGGKKQIIGQEILNTSSIES